MRRCRFSRRLRRAEALVAAAEFALAWASAAACWFDWACGLLKPPVLSPESEPAAAPCKKRGWSIRENTHQEVRQIEARIAGVHWTGDDRAGGEQSDEEVECVDHGCDRKTVKV
ncbi:hypothetical protein B0H14DRAFT_2816569, partial [Mycena olivaceomarginata]